MKVLVGTFNHEKALVGAFSVTVNTDESFVALLFCLQTNLFPGRRRFVSSLRGATLGYGGAASL